MVCTCTSIPNHPNRCCPIIPLLLSRPRDSRPNHTLFHALHALQPFQTLLLNHIHIQLLHNLDHQVQTLKEPVNGDAQHAVSGCCVGSPQNRFLFVLAIVRLVDSRFGGSGGGNEGKGALNQRRELLVDGESTKGGFSEAVGREGRVDCAVMVSVGGLG